MKYLVIVRHLVNDGTSPKAVYEKDTLDEAMILFHQESASAYATNTLVQALITVLTTDGASTGHTTFIDRTPTPEPESDETTAE